jgi:GNAT superfamily N-acetyltransferase
MKTMTMTDEVLYRRGLQTLLSGWRAVAQGCSGADVRLLPGVAVSVFPHGPESAFYNNAMFDGAFGLVQDSALVVDAMQSSYAEAGVEQFAAMVHEGDVVMRAELEGRGYTVEETTLAMGVSLDEFVLPPSDVELEAAPWSEYVAFLGSIEGVPPGLLVGVDPHTFHVIAARAQGERVAIGLTHDHQSDSGVYNVTTIEAERRRGLGIALTARLLSDAKSRGCTTATLQSTPMAERVYAALGFRDLGKILEYSR